VIRESTLHNAGMVDQVLYAVVCGSPVARDVGKLVELAKAQGWDVCVVATPDALKFIDLPRLATLTGHPIRYRYKNPGEPDLLPPATAMVVAPATVNTVNKWAAGIADTLALGLLVEAVGMGLPIVSLPYTNSAMAAHPAFRASMANLREWGVKVLFGDDVLRLHPPGTGEQHLDEFPWWLALDELERHPALRTDAVE
jgi:phosphopantothenoylcysteine synthetase/decarboxylase